MSGVSASVEYVWRYEASLGLVGVPARDGRLLLPPPPYPPQAPHWAGRLPAPVLAYERVSRAGSHRGGDAWQTPQPVAVIERVELRGERPCGSELVACGRFGDTELAASYAGALAVDAVALGMDLDEVQEVPLYRATGFAGWRLRAALVVDEPAWERALLSRPRVWREKVIGA